MRHQKLLALVGGHYVAHCSQCRWQHRGSHQDIIEAWHAHTEDMGQQQHLARGTA